MVAAPHQFFDHAAELRRPLGHVGIEVRLVEAQKKGLVKPGQRQQVLHPVAGVAVARGRRLLHRRQFVAFQADSFPFLVGDPLPLEPFQAGGAAAFPLAERIRMEHLEPRRSRGVQHDSRLLEFLGQRQPQFQGKPLAHPGSEEMMTRQIAERAERIGSQLGAQLTRAFPADFAPGDQGEQQVRDHAASERIELRRLFGAARPGAPFPGPVQFLGDAQQDGTPRASGILEGRQVNERGTLLQRAEQPSDEVRLAVARLGGCDELSLQPNGLAARERFGFQPGKLSEQGLQRPVVEPVHGLFGVPRLEDHVVLERVAGQFGEGHGRGI